MTDVASQLLRVYCLAGDRAGNESLHHAVIEAARRAGLAGATSMSAIVGFSAGGHFFSQVLLETMSDRQPIVVEILDQADQIAEFLPVLLSLVLGRRLVTLQSAVVLGAAAASAGTECGRAFEGDA